MSLLPARRRRHPYYNALYDALSKAGVHLELDYAPRMYDGPNIKKPIQHPNGGFEKVVIRLPSCHRWHSGATNGLAAQVYEAETVEQAAVMAIDGGREHQLTSVANACRSLCRRLDVA